MEPLYLSIILICAGIAVVVGELFLPTAGILGIIAAICFVSGIIVGFNVSFATGMIMMIITLTVLPLMFMLMVKVWPHTPIGKRILLKRAESPDDVLPKDEYLDELKGMVGQLGIAKTKMLPSGMVVVNGRKHDAISQGLPIEQGDTIQVVAIKGNRMVVVPYDGNPVDQTDLPASANDILSQPIEELGIDALDDPLG